MHTHFHSVASAFLLTMLLAGCAVGPDYQRAEVSVPQQFKEATLSPEAAEKWQAAQPKDALSRGRWWAIFNDPTLDALQDQAASANQDLKAAAARVRQARALRQTAQADRYPTVDGGFGPTRQRTSAAAQGLPDDALLPLERFGVPKWVPPTKLIFLAVLPLSSTQQRPTRSKAQHYSSR